MGWARKVFCKGRTLKTSFNLVTKRGPFREIPTLHKGHQYGSRTRGMPVTPQTTGCMPSCLLVVVLFQEGGSKLICRPDISLRKKSYFSFTQSRTFGREKNHPLPVASQGECSPAAELSLRSPHCIKLLRLIRGAICQPFSLGVRKCALGIHCQAQGQSQLHLREKCLSLISDILWVSQQTEKFSFSLLLLSGYSPAHLLLLCRSFPFSESGFFLPWDPRSSACSSAGAKQVSPPNPAAWHPYSPPTNPVLFGNLIALFLR